MIQVLAASWALLLGMLLLMVGNGLQGTLLGVRGGIEGFSTLEMSVIMSAYFAGFLFGSRLAPEMIRRVGHVRVFAALASFISAALILFPAVTDPWAWVGLRVLVGFAFSGVYVTAESWLNNAADNANRGKALSLYMVVQMAGLVSAQGLLALGDPAGFVLFIIPSVLVSISFAPILLSISPTPAFDTTKPMNILNLFHVSPLGCVGTFLMGGVYSGLFGMASVFGTQAGLSVAQISAFVAMIFVGGLVLQYPIGWISDRMDRRRLIFLVALGASVAALLGMAFGSSYSVLLAVSFLIGGTSNPLYSLLIAYTNDFLDHDDMAAGSGGLLFLNGIGAVTGPVITGWAMSVAGPPGFFLFIAVLALALAGYAAYRMTQRPAPAGEHAAAFAPVMPSSTSVAVEAAIEVHEEATQATDQ